MSQRSTGNVLWFVMGVAYLSCGLSLYHLGKFVPTAMIAFGIYCLGKVFFDLATPRDSADLHFKP